MGSEGSNVSIGRLPPCTCSARDIQSVMADRIESAKTRIGAVPRDQFEAAFRDIEEAVIDELSQRQGLVLSTGGGAVLRPINRQRLHERGTVIYLRSSPEQLCRRLRHDTKRPLLQGGDPLKKLQALHAERDPLYRECAHFVIDTHGVTLPMLVNRVLMQLELMPPQASA